MGYLVRRKFRLTPEFHPPALRVLHSGAGAFADQAALVVHMKQHFRFTGLKLRGLAGAAEVFLLVATINPEPAPPNPAAAARDPETVRCSDALKENLLGSG
jgi:hypothetical protein